MLELADYVIGRGGLISPADKVEGDGCTPLGTYPLREVWYRPDRVSQPTSNLPLHKITPEDCWCDDPEHALYNQNFHLPPLLPLGEEQDLVGECHEPSKSEEGYSNDKPHTPHQLSKHSQASVRKLTSPPRGEEDVMARRYRQQHTISAKQLRKDPTNAEKKLWHRIRNRQINSAKFRRQQPIGKYITDFVCQSHKLIIELDGGHHNYGKQEQKDKIRDTYLKAEGYNVLRFWNHDVLQNIDGVLETIAHALCPASPLGGEASFLSEERAQRKLVRGKYAIPASFEHLWREDHAYDLVVVVGYNDDPPIPGKGSAIFIHCMHDDNRPTAGCIALEKGDLLALISILNQNSAIQISDHGITII